MAAFTPKNELATQVLAALSGTEFEPEPGYFRSQNFCIGVPVGPTGAFKLGQLLANIVTEVSYDLWPNGKQYVAFPAASVRLA